MYLSNIGAKKLSLFLKGVISEKIFQQFSEVLNINITSAELKLYEEKYIPQNFVEQLLWNTVVDNPIAETALELALFEYEYLYSKDIFQLLSGELTEGITFKIVLSVIGQDFAQSALITDAYIKISKILNIKKNNSDIDKIRFNADFTLISFIRNQNYVSSTNLQDYINVYFPDTQSYNLMLWENQLNDMYENTFYSGNSVGIVYGENFSGKKFFVRNIISRNDNTALIVNYQYFKSDNDDDLKLKIIQLIRDCYLLQAVLCISDITLENESLAAQNIIVNTLKLILSEYSFFNIPLFITSNSDISLVPYLDYPCFTFYIPRLNSFQSIEAWNYFKNQYDIEDNNCFDEIADRIILPVGKISNAIYSASIRNIHNDKRKLSELCYSLMDDNSFKGVSKIYPKYTWNDLKLPDNEKNILQQICSYVKYKDFIMENWEMSKSYQYGSCASALFTGPPGTGKTMSAHVIANSLNLALYKVDLSQIVDKYIGETEKHLNEIFNYAESSNAVLFFDEADALIGKRSDIADSKDKFANTQVSYILQKIEEYNGIVLMATNYSNNIDPAIIRRIRYVVKFQIPDKKIREEIWHTVFSAKVPHDNIDFKLLSSDEFEFSGAVIKNIALNAAVLAVSENSSINMSHIARSIVSEYHKAERTIIPESLKQFLKD